MAKGAPEQQQGGGGDRSLDFLWLLALIVGGAVLIWYFGKVYIAMAVFKVKLYEIISVEFIFRYWTELANLLNLPSPDLQHLGYWKNFIHYSLTEMQLQKLSQ